MQRYYVPFLAALAVALFAVMIPAASLSAQETPVYTIDNPPPPPEFESRTLQFRVLPGPPQVAGDIYADPQTVADTYRVRYLGGEGSLFVDLAVGAEMDVFVPSDANISSNAAAVGNRASLKPGRKFTVTRFLALANGIIANDLQVRSGLVVSAAPVAGLAENRIGGYWGRRVGKEVVAPTWGEIKAGFQE